MSRQPLAHRVAVVTGSSRGIGQAIAVRLAQAGATVVVNAATSAAEAHRVAAELPVVNGQRHAVVMADIGDPREVARLMREVGRRHRRVDILVNNAGVTRFVEHRRLDELDAALFDRIYRVNVRGAFLCVQQALPLLRKSRGALIVNVASIASLTGIGSNVAYCASKAALVTMTKSLARALAPRIRVNSVSPGLTETELIRDWKRYRREQTRRTPLGRLARPEDVADAVYALATSLTYVTGHNLIVDGGRILN